MKKLLSLGVLLLLCSVFFNNKANAQLTVDTTISIENLLKNYLLGEGITVSNIKLTGMKSAIGAFDGSKTDLGINKGMLITTGYATNAIGPNVDLAISQYHIGVAGDPLLDALIPPPYTTEDAVRIEFDFIPIGDTLSLRYVFGSEEYPDYVGAGFTDAFGFFISGPNPAGGTYNNENLALVPGSSLPVMIDNINSEKNSEYYISNENGKFIEYNAFTTVLTAVASIVPCQTYKIILVIGDVGDGTYDSGVFLEAGSFSSKSKDVNVNVRSSHIDGAIEGCANTTVTFKLNGPTTSNYTINYSILGTATNGVDYATIPSSVTIPAGKDSAFIAINPLNDALTEGIENVVLKFLLSSCSSDSQTVTIPIKDYISMNLSKTDTTIKAGDSFNMKVNVTGGSNPYTYSWSTGQVTSVPYINVSPTTTTTYRITVKDFCAKTVSSSIIVTVGATCVANAGLDKTICSGNTTTLDGTGGGTYAWTPTVSIVSGATTSKPTVKPSVTTTYTLVISKEGCTASDNVVIVVNPTPIANAGADKTIAAGSSTTLRATGGANYLWSNGASIDSIWIKPSVTTTYCVTVINNGCSASDCVTVTVITSSVSAGQDKSVCHGISTDLTAIGATTYLWSTGATTATISVSPTVTTTYRVTGTISGITSSDDIVVTINPLPTANAGSNKTIVAGGSTPITATGGGTYAWSTGASTSTITVSPTNNTTYKVTVTLNGCTASDDVVVYVQSMDFSVDEDTEICKGASTTLTATGADTYLWNTGATTATITVSPTITTIYSVTGTKLGVTAVGMVSVYVNNPPTVNAGSNKSICRGSSTSITATATNYDTLVWSTGVSTATITVSPTTTTTYKITATNNCGNVTDDIVVTVNALPNANAGGNKTIYTGASTMLTATGGGTYAWSTGETTATISVNPTTTTTYRLTVTLNGCTASDAAIVIVQAFSVNAGADKEICRGVSTSLTATGADSYQWSTGETTATINISPAVTTTYIVTGTKQGATASDAVIVTVNQLPTISAGVNKTICLGIPTTLTATGGATYAWSIGPSTTTITVNPIVNTTYHVTGTDAKGCVNTSSATVTVNALPNANAGVDKTILSGTSTTLTATGEGTYAWSTGASTATISVSPTISSTYTVTVTLNGCTASDAVFVKVEVLTVSAGADKAICIGNSTTITATGADSYQWSTGATTATITLNPTITATYRVTGTKNGFTASDDVIVTVNALPIVNLGEDKAICNGETYSIKANGNYTFVWNNGQTGSTLTVKPTTNTAYSVTATDANGCKTSDNIMIIVKPNPIVNAGIDKTIYQGTSTELSTNVTNIPNPINPQYNWSNGATTKTINVIPMATTTYISTITVDGCSGSDAVVVNVQELTIAVIGNTEICYGNSTMLTAVGTDTYLWSNGATTSSINVNPLQTTTYTVTGTKEGATATTSVIVKVNPIPQANLMDDTTINIGDTINITAYNGIIYYWSTGQTTATITVSPATKTNYQVTVTDFKGCVGIDNVNIEVRTPFSITKVTASRVTCATTQDAYAQVYVADGEAPITYLWSNGQTTQKATGLAKGTYTVTAIDNKGYVAIGSATVTGPGYVPEPMVNTININHNASTLKWTLVPNVNTYMVRYKESSGSAWKYYNANSVTDNVVINGLKEDTKYDWQIRAIIDNVNYSCFTEPIFFQTLAQNNCDIPQNLYTNLISTSRAKINWDNDSNAFQYIIRYQVKGSNNWRFTYVNGDVNAFILTNLAQGTTYEWSIRKFCQYGGYSDFVIPFEEFTTSATCTNPINLKEQNTTSTSSLLTWDQVDGAIYYMVRWRVNGTSTWSYAKPSKNMLQIGCSICDDVHKLKPNTTYEWELRAFCSADGSVYSNTFSPDTFTTSQMRLAISGRNNICIGENTTLIQSSKGEYLWSTGETTQAINVAPTENTTYTMTVTYLGATQTDSKVVTVQNTVLINAGGDVTICAGDSAKLIALGATNYEWSVGSLKDNITVMPNVTTTYIVTAIDGGCSGTDDVIVFVNPLPYVNAGADMFICEGQSAQLNATGGNTYSWSTGETNAMINVTPTELTYYTVTADNGNCTASDIVVVVVGAFNATATADMTICQGETTMLNATGGINYEWSTGQKTPSIYVTPNTNTTYTVTIKNANGCSALRTIIVTINDVLSVDAGTDVTVCKGNKVTLTANANNPTYFRWSTGSLKQAITVVPQQTTTYIVTVKSGNCSGIDKVIVNIVNCKNKIIDNGKLIIDNSLLSINIYPNPSYDGKVNVELIGLDSDAKLTLMSYTGAVLLEKVVQRDDNKQQLDLSSFANGIMFIRIESSNSIETFKIVKN